MAAGPFPALCGGAVPRADTVCAQPECQRNRIVPGHGQPFVHDILEREPGRAILQRIIVAPVDLRHDVVHITGRGKPQRHVRILLAVVVVVVALRADAENRLRLYRLDGGAYLLHQRVDVGAPPFGQVLSPAVPRVTLRVERFVCGGIKVVVELNSVHVIILHDLRYALHHHVLHLGQSGVVVQPAVRLQRPALVQKRRVVRRQLAGGHGVVEPHAVRVHPCLDGKAAGVGLLHKNGQRVIAGVLPLHARYKVAPGIHCAGVHRVPERAHLHDDGVQPQSRTVVQQRAHRRGKALRAGGIEHRPFQIAHPHGAVRHGRGHGLRLAPRLHTGRHRGKILPGRAGLPAARLPRGRACGQQTQAGGCRSGSQQFFHALGSLSP